MNIHNITFTLFQLDAFNPLWSNQDARERSDLSDMSSPDTYGDMASMIDIDHPSTAFYHSYGDNIGDLSIVQYGPDPTDLGLLLPIRRPGALKYDPRSQVLKCNEIFLCLCATQVLEMIVRKKLNDSTRPSDATRLTDWLSDLRLEYNTISKLGIKEEHEKIKKSIKDLDQRHGSHRMKASAKRKDQEGVKCNDDQRSHKSVTTLRFIGEPNITSWKLSILAASNDSYASTTHLHQKTYSHLLMHTPHGS